MWYVCVIPCIICACCYVLCVFKEAARTKRRALKSSVQSFVSCASRPSKTQSPRLEAAGFGGWVLKASFRGLSCFRLERKKPKQKESWKIIWRRKAQTEKLRGLLFFSFCIAAALYYIYERKKIERISPEECRNTHVWYDISTSAAYLHDSIRASVENCFLSAGDRMIFFLRPTLIMIISIPDGLDRIEWCTLCCVVSFRPQKWCTV